MTLQNFPPPNNAYILAKYIQSIENFPVPKNQNYGYDHMGAILTDAILQAGLNYQTVVAPRVRRVLTNYPDADVTSVFLNYIHRDSAFDILQWQHAEKPRRLLELTTFLYEMGIESRDDLYKWLIDPENGDLLIRIRGIGLKTVDYIKNLVNIPTVAIDRHVRNFVHNAGISSLNYTELRSIVINAATILDLSPSNLDYAIWSFMSEKMY